MQTYYKIQIRTKSDTMFLQGSYSMQNGYSGDWATTDYQIAKNMKKQRDDIFPEYKHKIVKA